MDLMNLFFILICIHINSDVSMVNSKYLSAQNNPSFFQQGPGNEFKEICILKVKEKEIKLSKCKTKIVNVTECDGVCHSFYRPGTEISKPLQYCRGCLPVKLEYRNIKLDCEQDAKIKTERLLHILSCSCNTIDCQMKS